MSLFNEEFPCFASEKIILRRISEDDQRELALLFDYELDETSVNRFLAESKASWNSRKTYMLGVVSAHDHKLKGIIECYGHQDEQVEIGYRIIPAERHKGYASEAVYLLVHELIKNEDIETVYARCSGDNEDSLALLRHNGFEQIEEVSKGTLKFAYYRNPGAKERAMLKEGMKEIYLAAGCFWGSEKAFKLLDGVKETETGYANGTLNNPRYEDVCRGNTGFRETVRVVYDPACVSLETIMKAYFLCIDPTVKNRQGNDIGTQYQTGVYYTDGADEKVLSDIFAQEKKKYQTFAVELEPLKNYFSAEEYHQNYLDKNPNGYCHITKIEFDALRALNKKQ